MIERQQSPDAEDVETARYNFKHEPGHPSQTLIHEDWWAVDLIFGLPVVYVASSKNAVLIVKR